MKRHLSSRWTLLISFALFAWLGIACIPGLKITETTEVIAPSTGGVAAETAEVVVPATEIVGRWRANIEMPEGGGDLELILNIRQSASGTLSAFLDVPIMDAYDIPITFSYDDGVVQWEVPDYGTAFNGRLIDSSTIEGTVTNPEGGPPGTITFRRVE